MHAQHSALKQHASHTRVQLPSSGFFAFLNKLSGAAANATDFASIRINADWLCVVVSFVCLAFAALEGFAYNNIAQALGWGIPLFLGSLVVTRLYAGHPLTMHINALLLVGMGALHVHISRGLPEYHFSFFMLLPVMLAYRDTRPLLSMGLFIVIDRQPAAGMETSFANGGQISVSHAEPWANPGAPKKVLKWLMREDAPLLFRLRADARQWRWGMQFLRECTPEKTRHNIIQMVNLGTFSRDTLQELRTETGIEYNCLTKGILHFYTNQQEFDDALEPAEIMREFGCDRKVIDRRCTGLRRRKCRPGQKCRR